MQFTAANTNYLTLPGGPDFNAPQGTLLFWVKTAGIAGAGGGGAMLFERRSTSGGLYVAQLDDGRLQVAASGSSSAVRSSITTDATISDDHWHQIGVVYGQGATDGLSVFIDGRLIGSRSNSGAWSFPATLAINLGRSTDATVLWRRFNGSMDDIRIYNRSLDAGEIGQAYQGDGGISPADIGVDLASALRGTGTSAFVRIPFVVADPAALNVLTLRVKYNDGYAAWINGRRVSHANDPDPLGWDSAATAVHSGAFSDVVIQGVLPGLLHPGTNILDRKSVV